MARTSDLRDGLRAEIRRSPARGEVEPRDLDAALVYAEAMVRRDPDCIVLSVAHLSPDDDEQLVATPFGTAMWGGAGFKPLHGDDLVLEYVPAIEAARELVATAMAA